MADQRTFEARLQDVFDRYLEAAPTAVDARAMAAAGVASGRRTRGSGLRWLPVFGRVAWVAIAALLAMAIAILGGGANNLIPHPSTPPSTDQSPRTPAPTLTGEAPPWDALVLRVDSNDPGLIDVVLVRPNGQERVIRQVSASLPDFDMPLQPRGSVSRDGWLAITTDSQPGQLPLAAYRLLDLSDPAFVPITVPYPPAVRGSWSSTGLFALSSTPHLTDTSWKNIAVINPRTGATLKLGQVDMFGGGPSIVWASDASGIWDNGRIQPASGGADIPIGPELTFADRGVGKGGTYLDACSDRLAVLCTFNTVALFQADGSSQVWYTSPDSRERVTDAQFASDGTTVLVTVERLAGTVHQAILVRVAAPGVATQVLAFDLEDGASAPQIAGIAPDDQTVAFLYLDKGDFASSPLLGLDGSSGPVDAVGLIGWVPGPAAESWPTTP